MTCLCMLKIAVYYVADAMTEVVTSLQCKINQHNDWFKRNHLTVNASKCCTILSFIIIFKMCTMHLFSHLLIPAF